MEILFWTCWILECVAVLWWMITDAKQKHMTANRYPFLCLLYLLGVLGLRLGLHEYRMAEFMVMIPAIPLLALAIIIAVAAVSKKKWN